MKVSKKGTIVAATVAGLFVARLAMAADQGMGGEGAKEAGVKCAGINACKGQGACGGAGHSCAGKNDCKGKGWQKSASADECTKKGGTVVN